MTKSDTDHSAQMSDSSETPVQLQSPSEAELLNGTGRGFMPHTTLNAEGLLVLNDTTNQ